jgi:alpha-1,6-mannosyltransferase
VLTVAERYRVLVARPVVLRYLGLAGALLLAADAYLFGAFPARPLGESVAGVAGGRNGVIILVFWLLGILALGAAWWHGLRLAGRGVLTVRWAIATAVLWMAPFAVAPPTGSRDVYAYACQGALYAAGHSPYTQGVAALPCPWLDSVSPIWRDTPAPYGPVFLILAGAAARLGSQVAAVVAFRVMAAAGVALIAAVLPVLARRAGVPADRAVWLVLACPLMAVHVVGGAHNDAMTIGLLLAGLAVLASRNYRPVTLAAGGVLLGLAVGFKTTIGVALPFAALFGAGVPEGPAAPAGGPDLRVVLKRAAAVVAAALAALLAFTFGSGLGFGWVTALSRAGDSVGWTSPPTAVGLAAGYLGRPFGLHLDAVPAVRAVALAILPIALLAILWRALRRDPLYAAALALLATIFVAPITQPWYLLWPLSMLAATTVAVRWLAVLAIASMFKVLPDGYSVERFTQVPGSFVMTALAVWVGVRAWTWLRGAEPHRIDLPADHALTT